MDSTKNNLWQVQKPVQANQTLSACDNSDELSDNELAAVNGGSNPDPLTNPIGFLQGLLGRVEGDSISTNFSADGFTVSDKNN